ncbi:glycosyltransferase family 4 protein [Alicyclobacillus fastidiosus]|uniref:Glycosyltransferase family 4 protein n=1 Tax=Alicyclobacillus fastidiosus TaxID=392011 RepID=A0ABY6ZBH3_9BACL|nr:glycosyltransferase family 4 protein [Alicyclobacillus fastidiosus]WAH39892.1 glycosyltransferase family 4 protein [Alicyclobacillus fastidiosus]GMA61164.1 hypothetical protein GCM10025859_16040 [Alicyclobacillus fastidiosus]
MRVGHLTSDDFGGVSTMLYHLVMCSREFGRHQHDVIIADVNQERTQTLSNRLGKGNYRSVERTRLSRLRWLVRHAHQYDVLVAHKTSWYFWLGIYHLLFAWRCRPGFIAVIHDGTLFLPGIQFRERMTNLFMKKFSQQIIVVRENFKSQIERTLSRSKGVHYIGNGLPSTFSTGLDGRSTPSGQQVILSLSRLDDVAKDVGTILQAVHLIDDCNHQVIVGGEGRYRSHWVQLRDDLSLGRQVKFVGEVSDVQGFFQEGTLFVLSSTFYEGTPMVLLEAMLSGIPVLASRSALPDWALEHRLCLDFEPGNGSDLAKAIRYFCSLHASEIEEMTDCARQYVREHFDVRQQLLAYETVIEQVTA